VEWWDILSAGDWLCFAHFALRRAEAAGHRAGVPPQVCSQSAIEKLALFRTNAHPGDTVPTEKEAEAYLTDQLQGFGLRLGPRPHVSSFRFQIINHKS
jgi:hypothetical protein